MRNAYPGEALINVCEKHWQFARFRAGLTPNIVITEAQAKILYTTNNARDGVVSQKGDQVTIKRGKSKGKYKIVEVTATIENKGKLATHVARGAQLACNREDVVWLISDREKVTFLQGTPFRKLGVLEGIAKIPGYRAREGGPSQTPQQRGYGGFRRSMMPEVPKKLSLRQKSDEKPEEKQKGPKREVKWLVAVEGDSPLKIVVSSQKGGTTVKTLSIK